MIADHRKRREDALRKLRGSSPDDWGDETRPSHPEIHVHVTAPAAPVQASQDAEKRSKLVLALLALATAVFGAGKALLAWFGKGSP